MYKEVKCKKCRQTLFDQHSINNLRDIHCPINIAEPNICKEYQDQGRIFQFVIHSWSEPYWIMNQVGYNTEKKRINCPHCGEKVGSFNALQRRLCKCGSEVPYCYFIESRIDLVK